MARAVRKAKRGLMSRLWQAVTFGWVGGYDATDPQRKVLSATGRISTGTANQILSGNLAQLRAYCRNLERNNPTARAGIEALTALVVGEGIALEPDTGDKDADAMLREAFLDFCEDCGMSGESIWQLQSLGIREVVTAGEGLWRIVTVNEPGRMVPIRLLPLDAEFISDYATGEISDPTRVNGIWLDKYGRPQAYEIANPEHPGEIEKVKASAIIHFFERRRPVQNRGEPWFAPVIETLITERDLVAAELKAAVITASLGIAIESDMPDEPETTENGEEKDPRDPVHDLALGSVVRMFPGEKVHPFSHERPSQQIAPFRQMLRGDIAAALRIPQRFLDRDVSRANYSSMRADMLDTERLLGPVREWYGNQTIGRLYRMVLPMLAASLGLPMPRPDYRLVPDGQPYVDPQKDALAALTAIGGSLSTYEHEIGKRGGDYRQVFKQWAAERELMAEMGIEPQSPNAIHANEPAKEPEQKPQTEASEVERMQFDAIMRRMDSLDRAPSPAPSLNFNYAIDPKGVELLGAAFARNIPQVVIPQQPAPIVNVATAAPVIEVRAAEQPAPVVKVTVPRQAAPVVNVAAPDVTINNEVIVPQRTIVATPNRDGSVTMTPVEER